VLQCVAVCVAESVSVLRCLLWHMDNCPTNTLLLELESSFLSVLQQVEVRVAVRVAVTVAESVTVLQCLLWHEDNCLQKQLSATLTATLTTLCLEYSATLTATPVLQKVLQ